MASEVEQKLDQVLATLQLLAPEVLSQGIYRAKLLDVQERLTNITQRKYWTYKFEYELLPGRFVWGNFVEGRKPDVEEEDIDTMCTIFVTTSDYNERVRNIVTEVYRA